MKAQDRLRRHGYHLMSLASIGALACLGAWIAGLGTTWWLVGQSPAGRDFGVDEQWLLTAASTVALFAQQWALSRLHEIGRILHVQPFVSAETARAWERFARAMAIAMVAMLICPEIEHDVGRDSLDIRIGLEFSEAYSGLIACLCAFSVAWLLRDAAALKEENESII